MSCASELPRAGANGFPVRVEGVIADNRLIFSIIRKFDHQNSFHTAVVRPRGTHLLCEEGNPAAQTSMTVHQRNLKINEIFNLHGLVEVVS